MDAPDSNAYGSIHISYIPRSARTGSLYRPVPERLFGGVSAVADIHDALSDILQD